MMTEGERIEAEAIARQNVLREVGAERRRQDAKWGGATHDDKWNALDWHEMIADYNAWARRMACMGSLDKARNRYVQLAALAVAVVEAIDRRTQAQAATHWNTRHGYVVRGEVINKNPVCEKCIRNECTCCDDWRSGVDCLERDNAGKSRNGEASG